MMPNWTVSPITDSVDQYISIVGEALQCNDAELWKTYIRRVGPENLRGVWRDNTLAGGLAFYRMAQWYGGRPVSTAGVSGVAINPAVRGGGACKTLLVELMQECYSNGIPMASLYASTQQLYRSVGFEQSGHQFTYSIPMSSLCSDVGNRSLVVSRHVDPPMDVLSDLADSRAEATNGNLRRTAGLWERVIEPIGTTTSTYILGTQDDPQGFIVLHHGTRSAGYPQPLIASDWVAKTPIALRRMISIILDHRSMCDRFQWTGSLQDRLVLTASEQNIEVVSYLRSLNRVICFRDALQARGYPETVNAELHFSVSDSLLTGNQGNWVATIRGGHASVAPGGRGDLRLDISAVVPLFTSLLSCSQLIQAGSIQCDSDEQCHLANAVFAGPSPWTSELF